VEEGIVPGGGVALIRAKTAVSRVKGINADQDAGISIVLKALEEPARCIAYNAGDSADVVVNSIAASTGNFGYNAANGTYGDLVEQGVIDPTKVTKTALINAASVAGLIITTDCSIAELPKKDSNASAGMPNMPMM
jgi:chaperonin GroEL